MTVESEHPSCHTVPRNSEHQIQDSTLPYPGDVRDTHTYTLRAWTRTHSYSQTRPCDPVHEVRRPPNSYIVCPSRL